PAAAAAGRGGAGDGPEAGAAVPDAGFGLRAARLPDLGPAGADAREDAGAGGPVLPGDLERLPQLHGNAQRGRTAGQLPGEDLREGMMRLIRDLLARDLSQKIEEIVKVDQTDEAAVYGEITEYVVTDRIRDHY